jgi:hypothetical protein
MSTIGITQVRIKEVDMDWLLRMKKHPKQPYHEVITEIFENYQRMMKYDR